MNIKHIFFILIISIFYSFLHANENLSQDEKEQKKESQPESSQCDQKKNETSKITALSILIAAGERGISPFTIALNRASVQFNRINRIYDLRNMDWEGKLPNGVSEREIRPSVAAKIVLRPLLEKVNYDSTPKEELSAIRSYVGFKGLLMRNGRVVKTVMVKSKILQDVHFWQTAGNGAKDTIKIKNYEKYENLRNSLPDNLFDDAVKQLKNDLVYEIPKSMLQAAVAHVVSQRVTDNHYGQLVAKHVMLQVMTQKDETPDSWVAHASKRVLRDVVVEAGTKALSQAIVDQLERRIAPLLPTQISHPQENSLQGWLISGGKVITRVALDIGVNITLNTAYDAVACSLEDHTKKIGFSLKIAE